MKHLPEGSFTPYEGTGSQFGGAAGSCYTVGGSGLLYSMWHLLAALDDKPAMSVSQKACSVDSNSCSDNIQVKLLWCTLYGAAIEKCLQTSVCPQGSDKAVVGGWIQGSYHPCLCWKIYTSCLFVSRHNSECQFLPLKAWMLWVWVLKGMPPPILSSSPQALISVHAYHGKVSGNQRDQAFSVVVSHLPYLLRLAVFYELGQTFIFTLVFTCSLTKMYTPAFCPHQG